MRNSSYFVAIALIAMLALVVLPYNFVEAKTANSSAITVNATTPIIKAPNYANKLNKLDSISYGPKRILPPNHSPELLWNYPNNITINNLVISDTTKQYNDTVLIVQGNLTIVNSEIIFNTTANGTSGILVLNGSVLKIVNSTINYTGDKSYFIYAEANTTVEISGGSKIYYASEITVGFNYTTIGVGATVRISNSMLVNSPVSVIHTDLYIMDVHIYASVSGLAINAIDAYLSNTTIQGLHLYSDIINGVVEAIKLANMTTVSMSNVIIEANVLDTLGGVGTFIGIDLANTTGVSVNVLNMTINATGAVPYAIAIYASSASISISSAYIDAWIYGFGMTDLIMAEGPSAVMFIGSEIYLHAYQGCQWGVALETMMSGMVMLQNSKLIVDAYGYGGQNESDSYFVVPMFSVLGGIMIDHSVVQYIGNGFAFVLANYLIYGSVDIEYSTFDVITYGTSFVYAVFYNRPGYVDIHYSNVSLPAYGDSLTLMFISTTAEGGKYNITNSKLVGLSSLLEGIVAVNTTTSVYLDNVEMMGFTDAVVLSNVTNVVIRDSEFYNNTVAVKVGRYSGYGGEIVIENSKFANKEYNLDASYSANIKILNCEFSKTTELGINFDSVVNITFVGNKLHGLTFFLTGSSIEHFATHNITNNTVNDKDLIYVVNEKDKEYSGEIGALIIVNSSLITISDIDFTEATVAITLAYVKNVSINGVAIGKTKYGIYSYEGEGINVKSAKFTYDERGIYASKSKVSVYDSIFRFTTNGIYAEDSEIYVEKSMFVDNGLGITATNTNIEVENSVIYRNTQYGIYLSGNFSKAEIHYSSIYSNRLHGIYSASNTSVVNASYNWWGVNNKGPELKEKGDSDDPEEIYGKFTDDTTKHYLKEPMWSPSEEGVIEAPEAPAVPNYAITAIIVIIGIIVAIALYMRKPSA